jgi:hypothetical protein
VQRSCSIRKACEPKVLMDGIEPWCFQVKGEVSAGVLFGRMNWSPWKVIAGWNHSDLRGVEEEVLITRRLVSDIGGISFSEAGSLRNC